MGVSEIKLTVGLPMYQSRFIGWVALESLCRQKNINFKWELIIAEEEGDLSFGKDRLYSYRERLNDIGCINIQYLSLKKWIPLSQKWKMIGENSSNSCMFLLQAADCYSSHKRLVDTFLLYQEGVDWIQSQKHAMYDIKTDSFYVFDVVDKYRKSKKKNKKPYPVGADMAMKTSWAKSLPFSSRKTSIDGWLLTHCLDMRGKKFNLLWDESDSWSYSLNINGLNNISKREFSKSFYKKAEFIRKNIPSDIMDKIKDSKKYIGKIIKI